MKFVAGILGILLIILFAVAANVWGHDWHSYDRYLPILIGLCVAFVSGSLLGFALIGEAPR